VVTFLKQGDDERMKTEKPAMRTEPSAGRSRIRIVTTLFRHEAVNGTRRSVIRYACRTGNRETETPTAGRPAGTRFCRTR